MNEAGPFRALLQLHKTSNAGDGGAEIRIGARVALPMAGRLKQLSRGAANGCVHRQEGATLYALPLAPRP